MPMPALARIPTHPNTTTTHKRPSKHTFKQCFVGAQHRVNSPLLLAATPTTTTTPSLPPLPAPAVGVGVQWLPLPHCPDPLAHDLLFSSWLHGCQGVQAGGQPQHDSEGVLHTGDAHWCVADWQASLAVRRAA